eukprot:GFKZ01004879.1.p1 GENE.GFKZ01004879.1~~GFKZ01004879.1.p1  ORF type:complete len:218 (+),score=23.75 GFKZ01004879.1:144-797(+)
MLFVASQPLGLTRNQIAASSHSIQTTHRFSMTLSRRSCLTTLLTTAASAALSLTLSPTPHAHAAMYSSDTSPDSSFAPSGDPKKVATYMPQIEAGYSALVSLQSDWVAKTRDFDGDVVRRVLGTVGVKSPLFNIRKSFMKAWQVIAESSDDFALIDRMESEWNDVLNGISAVDYQLYSVSFTELVENKETLIANGKRTLDETIGIYADLLQDFRSVI